MEKETKSKEMEGMTVYEVGYTLLPSLALEQVPARVDELKELIQKAGGDVISLESPTLIDLAYPMTKVIHTSRQKCVTGYFGWIKFAITAEGILSVKKTLDAEKDILRYLIIKTVRENTLLHGKMSFKGGDEEKKIEFSNALPEITLPESTPEEIDKSIDELVIV
jgi:ribosomal protein S6